MTTILVTGGDGQLATCIKDLENDYKDLNLVYADYLDLDITKSNQVNKFFKDNYPIQYCINCAAYTAVDKAESEVEKAYAINAEGAKNIASACNENKVKLIHISTDFVFDGNKTEPYIEEDKPNPISVYGASKLKGEEEIRDILKEYFIIRTSWLYSEHGNNFMKTMLRLSETRDEISVVCDQIGTPTYAGDLASVIFEIIDSKNELFGVYHYSNEGVTGWDEFAKAIFEISKRETKIKPIISLEYPTAAKRPCYSVLSKDKIKRTLNILIPNWKESLIRVIEKI